MTTKMFYLLLSLLVKIDDFEGLWDGVCDKLGELLLLDGKGIKILCGPELELSNFIANLLDLDGLSIWAGGKLEELPWGSNTLWHLP